MCTVSMVGDQYGKKSGWPTWPDQIPFPAPRDVPEGFPWHPKAPVAPPNAVSTQVTRLEFEALKRDFEKMKQELEAAKAQDVANGEPDCEMDEKVDVIQQIADMLKISLGDIFKK